MTEPMPMPPPEKGAEAAVNAKKSKGEKLFDRAVYAGIAGVGTFIATIVLTDALKYGRLNWFNKAAANVFEKTANVFLRGRDNKSLAQDAAMTTSLMMGGNLMLLPVGIAEHHKVALVDGLNAAAEDPTPKEAIQKAPKQTWSSLAKSRGIAWLAVFGTLKGLGTIYGKTMDSFERQTGELACRIMRKPTHRGPLDVITALKDEAAKLAERAPTEEVLTALKDTAKKLEAFETKTYRYGKIGAIDVFATIGSATLLYIGGHFFARKHEEKIEHRAQRKQPQGEVPLRDESSEVALARSDAPNAQIAGLKQHEGMARDAVLSQQV